MSSSSSSKTNTKALLAEMLSSRGVAGIPSSLHIHPSKPIVYFMGRPAKGERSAFCATTPSSSSASTSSADDTAQVAPWFEFASVQNEAGNEGREIALSKEEILMRERMRGASVSNTGVTGFFMQGDQMVLSHSSSVYSASVAEHDGVGPLSFAALGAEARTRLDLNASPDLHFLSYIVDGNVCVEHNGVTSALTQEDASQGITAGVAEFIIQEEFDRFTGYYWCPVVHGSNGGNEDGDEDASSTAYRMLYVRVDETAVPKYAIPEVGHTGNADVFRYPQAGEPNAVSSLHVACFDALASSVCHLATEKPLEETHGWVEYIPRLGWTPDGTRVWAQLLDRKQQHMEVVVWDVDVKGGALVNPRTVLEENTELWYNVTDLLRFIPGDTPRLLFASERTGFRHLYVQELDLDASGGDSVVKGEPVQVTSGEYQVNDAPVALCDAGTAVVYSATRDSVLRNNVYRSPLDGSQTVQLLTDAAYDHGGVVFNNPDDATLFATVYSTLADTPVCALMQLPSAEDASSAATPLWTLQDQVQLTRPQSFDVHTPHLFDFVNENGDTCHGWYLLPGGKEDVVDDGAAALPTLLYIYGGPHVQLVRDTFMWPRLMRFQAMAHLGYAVVCIDGRGSNNRGLAFEGHLRTAMGTFELHDQITGLKHLMATRGFVDPERIAVNGWSYGGYMSLMAMCQHADFFRAAVSGAPVTRWELYDTGYTERYMDTPQDAPEAYEAGSVLSYADGFPEESGRLMIVHGLIDENVHFQHTAELLEVLNAKGKPYDLLLFPSERHGTRQIANALQYETRVLDWLQRNL